MTEVVICRTDDNRLDVTVHSVLSNTLRDAQNLCYSHKFARYVSGFWHSHAKTPRGIVACEQ
jgi:hypothetical protein